MKMIIVTFALALLLHPVCHSSTFDEDQKITITRQRSRNNRKLDKSEDEWDLRYFPEKTDVPEYDPRSIFADPNDTIDIDPKCDDGVTHLSYDWDESMAENYTCFGDIINPDVTITPLTHGAQIPPAYIAPHYCMNVNITYTDPLTTFGGHRKLWASYGEYKFIPKQRWLHNAEVSVVQNGAVIMLYHPCAHPQQIEKLRKIVKSCLFRHIITPYNLLPKDRPLALVTWGWQLSMNLVTPKLARRFIEERALKAPRNLNSDGKYNYALKVPATIVSDEKDSRLCIVFM